MTDLSHLPNAVDAPMRRAALLRWLPPLLGLLAMYVPTYVDLTESFWLLSSGTHGPIILAMACWLLWRDRAVFRLPVPPTRSLIAWALLAVGLLLYVIGRSQGLFQFQVGSQVPVFIGAAWLTLGREGVRRVWFPAVFLLFLMPIPGSILDQILLPLKQAVSAIVDNLLYAVGYPIARSGVVLSIGPYQLQIADACSGLNSMVALSGIGLFYTYLVGHEGRWRNAVLLACAIPVAFASNIVRVLGLVLVTYYFGDEAGHRFHDNAGGLEIVIAFGVFFFIDWLLGKVGRKRTGGRHA